MFFLSLCCIYLPFFTVIFFRFPKVVCEFLYVTLPFKKSSVLLIMKMFTHWLSTIPWWSDLLHHLGQKVYYFYDNFYVFNFPFIYRRKFFYPSLLGKFKNKLRDKTNLYWRYKKFTRLKNAKYSARTHLQIAITFFLYILEHFFCLNVWSIIFFCMYLLMLSILAYLCFTD